MKKQSLLLCACIAFFLIQFVSCVKPPKDFDPRDADNVLENCRVKRIIITENPKDTIEFTYNHKGDPVSIKPRQVSTGHTNKLFYYDNKARLTKFVSAYSDIQFESVHKYAYDNKGRIASDTDYFAGDLPDVESAFGKSVHHFFYDKYERIIADSVVVIRPFPVTAVTRYKYNAAGNLDNGLVYDNNVNIHRTNKVWMFIDRDYSVNNPATADGYSYYKLPLGFSREPGKPIFDIAFAQFVISSSVIEYDCK